MRMTASILACGLVLLSGALVGCRGDRSSEPPRQFFPDMDDSPKWKPQSESEFYVDGRTMRQPPEGALAFGRQDFDPTVEADWASPWLEARAGLLKDDDGVYRGVDADGAWLDTIPATIDVSREFIEHGRVKFDIYCAVCHGVLGDGQGLVAQRWSIPVGNFHDEKFKDRAEETGKDGYIFNTILNGKGEADAQTMPGYSHALSEHDAWSIVAYVRTLQAARNGGGS